MPNENCLKGMKCPECGYEDSFGIACDIVMLVDDDGIKDDIGDYDWDDDAHCECRECSHSGTVKDFKTPSPPTTLKTLVDRLKALKEEPTTGPRLTTSKGKQMKYKILVFVMRMLLPLCRSISHGNNPQNILNDAMGDARWYATQR